MQIAILTDGIFPYVVGGMQKHSFYLAKFLALRGHRILLVHCVEKEKSIPGTEEIKREMGLDERHSLETLGFHFPRLGFAPGHYLKESYLYSQMIFEKLEPHFPRIDFIYAKGFTAWYLLSKKKSGYKSIPRVGLKFHGYEMFQRSSNFRTKMEHWMLRSPVRWNNRYADYIFSYGGNITEIIRQLGVEPNKIINIPTGIGSDWITRQPPARSGEKINFVFIGRYERRKGIEELHKVLLDPAVVSRDFHFHFIGPVPPSRKIRSGQLTYHGSLVKKEQIQAVLDECHVLVVPSWSEGMPNVILEGMARGLAIIATDVGAVSAVVNEQNGWLIPAAEFSALRSALINAMSIPREQLDRMRQASLSKVSEKFTWEDVSARIEAEILRVCNRSLHGD